MTESEVAEPDTFDKLRNCIFKFMNSDFLKDLLFQFFVKNLGFSLYIHMLFK